MTDWVKKKLSREDIYHVREEAVKACKEYGLGCIPVLDEQLIFNAEPNLMQQLKDQIDSYQKKWQENWELSCICDMALRYLDIIEERKENGL